MKSFRELEVWRLGKSLALECYEITKAFPESERFGLSTQIRRAGVSIPSNLAEGWGRYGSNSIAQFARIAKGSLCELETQMEIARDLGYVSTTDHDEFQGKCQALGVKLSNYINALARDVREDPAPYQAAVEST